MEVGKEQVKENDDGAKEITEDDWTDEETINEAELEDLLTLNGLRRSRRSIKEPNWLQRYVKGKSGRMRSKGELW